MDENTDWKQYTTTLVAVILALLIAFGAFAFGALFSDLCAAGHDQPVIEQPIAPTPPDAPAAPEEPAAPVDPPVDPPRAPATAVAFPGAEGAGANATGGRGGRTILVTTLADSGPGSFRECVTASGARTCVFKVNGTIVLNTEVAIHNGNLTIAGQTAQGQGIQLNGKSQTTGTMLSIRADNIIIRYIKVRRGSNSGCIANQCGTTLAIFKGQNIMLDHVESQWNVDDGFTVWQTSGYTGQPLKNVSFSNCISAEGLYNHATTTILGANITSDADKITDIDYNRCLFMNASHRVPLAKVKSVRMYNTLSYNMYYKMSATVGGILMDFVNNKYKLGPMTSSSLYEVQAASFATGSATGDPSIYMVNNVGWHQASPTGDQWLMAANSTSENGTQTWPMTASRKRSTPQAALPVPITPIDPANLENTVLNGVSGVGASAYVNCLGVWTAARDSVTSRLVSQYINNTGITAQISSETEVGGFATIPAVAACSDRDSDGMPDAWEELKGYNANDPTNGTKLDASGYTYLENYINGQ